MIDAVDHYIDVVLYRHPRHLEDAENQLRASVVELSDKQQQVFFNFVREKLDEAIEAQEKKSARGR